MIFDVHKMFVYMIKAQDNYLVPLLFERDSYYV